MRRRRPSRRWPRAFWRENGHHAFVGLDLDSHRAARTGRPWSSRPWRSAPPASGTDRPGSGRKPRPRRCGAQAATSPVFLTARMTAGSSASSKSAVSRRAPVHVPALNAVVKPVGRQIQLCIVTTPPRRTATGASPSEAFGSRSRIAREAAGVLLVPHLVEPAAVPAASPPGKAFAIAHMARASRSTVSKDSHAGERSRRAPNVPCRAAGFLRSASKASNHPPAHLEPVPADRAACSGADTGTPTF